MGGWDPGRVGRAGILGVYARLVRVEHTVFSLPFAYVGALLSPWGCGGCTWREALLLGLAVVGLRVAGMAYNNIADYDVDRLNPRTRGRPLVVGAASFRGAWALVVAGSILYYASACALNRYACMLSPILWVTAMTYPHAKRLHWLPHIHLGLVLGLVVFGGAVGAHGDEAQSLADALRGVPWLYVAAVTLWVSGFDTIYAIQDMEFDRAHGLGSIPARLGEAGARAAAALQHAAAIALLLAAAARHGLGPIGWAATIAASALIAAQHPLAARGRVREAFNLNLLVALVLGLGLLADALAGC